MSNKKDKNKLVTMLISGVLVASAGTYAFASQYNQPTQSIAPEAVSSVASSETVSIVESSAIESVASVASVESAQSTAESVVVSSSAPKEETKVESTVAPVETQAPASQPEPTSASSASEANASSYVASLELGVCYYDIIDPETGKHVDIYNSRYNDLKKQLGGDAGKVDTDQSVACQNALKQFKAKQAASSTASTVK